MINFQKLPPIEDPRKAFEAAISKAKKRVSGASYKGDRLQKFVRKEADKIKIISDTLIKHFSRIEKEYPSIDSLPEFYIRLIDETIGADALKRSLAAMKFSRETIKKLYLEYSKKIREEKNEKMIKKETSSFLGRTSSVIKQISSRVEHLERSRRIMRKFPAIDTESFVVAIAGFPNVGKSTLLSRLTRSKPEIKNYLFTTKELNTGSFEYQFHKIQLVDTPGGLGRNKENTIEKLSTITRKYLANLVVFVFDPTRETEPQNKFFRMIKKEGKEVITYLSKTDIMPHSKKEYKKKYPEIITDPEKLKKAITSHFQNWLS